MPLDPPLIRVEQSLLCISLVYNISQAVVLLTINNPHASCPRHDFWFEQVICAAKYTANVHCVHVCAITYFLHTIIITMAPIMSMSRAITTIPAVFRPLSPLKKKK